MNSYIKTIVSSHLKDYIEQTKPELKPSLKKMFKCPCNCSEKDTVQILNNKMKCFTPNCKCPSDIFEYFKFTTGKNISEEDIGDYLIHKLNIKIPMDIDDLLNQYEKAGFSMFPLSSGNEDPKYNKMPLKGFKWADKDYYDKDMWKQWVERGYGLALKLGKVSKVVAVDIDDDDTQEKVKHMLGDTKVQTTLRGRHYLYNYDSDFDDIRHANLRSTNPEENYDMELRANNAYIVVAPTSVGGEIRSWNNNKIIDMPKELKEFLMDKIKNNKVKEDKDTIQECIDNEKIDIVDLSGQRNDTFVKLGGILRKELNLQQLKFTLSVISNNLIDKPLPKHELNAMVQQISKYKTYDKEKMAKQILERIEILDTATPFSLSKSLNYEQKDVEEVVAHLAKEEKIISIGNNKYKKINKVEWEEDFENVGIPVTFKVPYFHDYAYFDQGNMVIIGASSGRGKTHITGNILKKLVDQKITPYLITTEAGSKIGKVAKRLNMKVGDFKFAQVKDPTEIELQDNAVTIIDWLKPTGGDFAKTDATFEKLNDQLVKHGGFLFVMVQLRKDGTFFAPDQIDFYASLICRYNYMDNNGQQDNTNTYFETTKIRDSRVGKQHLKIMTTFDPETKTIELKK